jgi:hypothetical protein
MLWASLLLLLRDRDRIALLLQRRKRLVNRVITVLLSQLAEVLVVGLAKLLPPCSPAC